ncbi:MAG: hypothetical protein PF904_03085 [Kiritimatiellae bacterium]|jgi:hypothetical protein|nr:hypothetical protein [Kiritimatiellia bacterium]
MDWKRRYVCFISMVAMLLCVAVTSRADVIVAAGESLSITNVEDIGYADIHMGADATLAFPATGAASAGLNEYTRTGITSVGWPYIYSYGDWTRFVTNVYWAANTITNAATEYVYTGRWYLPDTGVYSFYEYMDDMAAIAVDGELVLRSAAYSDETCVQNISLDAGWHNLEVRLCNGYSIGGPRGSLQDGILYSPSNDLISVSNLTNAYPFVDPGDGSVLRPVHNGHLFQKIFVDGDVTFDLSEQDLAGPLVLSKGLLPEFPAMGGTVTITGGVGQVRFGRDWDSINFPAFNVDVAFSGVADPEGITFIEKSTVVAWPTSCLWRVEENATVALAGTNMLGAGDVYLTNHNIYVLSHSAVTEDATIHVQGSGLSAALKPCTVDSNGYWQGFTTILTNDVSLEGENATVALPLHSNFYLQGSISGTGTVVKTDLARVEILEKSDFVGLTYCNGGTLIFDSEAAGDSNNVVRVGANSTVALYPAGYGSTETATWIKRLEGSSNGKVYIPAKQTMTVDYVDGTMRAEGAVTASSVLHVNTLGTNAVLSAIRNVTIVVDHIESGASIIMEEGLTSLKVNGTGNMLEKLTITSGEVSVEGDFDVTVLEGAGTLVKVGDSTMNVNFSALTGEVKVNAGTFSCDGELLVTDSVLGSLPSLWLDASADNVFTQYKSYTFTNDFPIIEQWDDCRSGAIGFAKQTRGDDQWQTYPYLMTNAWNGKSVLSMGSYQTKLSSAYATRTEARRMPMDQTRTPVHVIMVFGSQDGGGAAVIGTNGGDNNFSRGGTTTEEYRDPDTPVFDNSEIDLRMDGVDVDGTTEGLSGAYQILTINTDDRSVGALGWDVGYQNAGGQNYAEMLFYTNILTRVEQVTIENYLAQKWGLPYTSFVIPSVTVADGATFEVGGSCLASNVTGRGSVVISGSASIKFSGIFAGAVEMDGGDFVIPDLADIPGDEAVPTTDLKLWIDPCMTNRAVLGRDLTPTRPLAISGFYDRTTDSRYLLGTCNTVVEGSVDRRPWLSEAIGPLGETQYWIDYDNIYDGETRGNTLRLNTNPDYIGTQNTVAVPTDVQSGFIVLDSSRGGGAPILRDVANSTVITRDNPQDVDSPIWGSITTDALKSGATYLDGISVDGATQGYSGRNELLSFVATNIFEAAYFGYYGGDSSLTPNRERIGEIILLESDLDETTRIDIEAYLMKKWLGKAHDGYVDVTESTVSGDGTLNAVRPSQLPSFDSGFNGIVNLSGSSFEYTVQNNMVGDYEIVPDSVTIPGTLNVPATGTINVDFDVSPAGGIYPLITFGSIIDDGFENWSLVTTGDVPEGIVRLIKTDTGLSLQIIAQGTIILVR